MTDSTATVAARMPVRRLPLILALLLCLPGTAAAATNGRSIYQSKSLWATINVCDTAAQPDTVGVRASIPGSGRRTERMWLRFQIQYFDSAEGLWHNLLQGGDSGWIKVGSARYRVRQSGWTFRFAAPAAGTTQMLRGAVTFEWRRGTKIVRRARKRTSEGHESSAGSDPPGFSAATCELR